MARLALAVLVVGLSLASIRADELDQFRQREQLLAQKWARETSLALEMSRRLERTDPASARETLQGALGQLKAAPGISDALRQDLSRRLQSRLNDIAVIAQPRPAKEFTPRPSGFATDSPRPLTPQISTPSSSPPKGGVSDIAKAFIDGQKNQVAKTNEARDNRGNGFNGVVSGIQSSAIPSDQALSLSPNHKEIMARRQPVVSAKEDAVMKALSSTLQADFTGFTFSKALEYLSEKTGLTIIPDSLSLKEAMVEYDDPVSFKVNTKVSLRIILRKILGERGLSYVVQEGTLSVVTTQKARESTVVRIYPVNDLVTQISPQPQMVFNPYIGGYVPAPPGTVPTYAQQMGATIADLVRSSVDPSYWAPSGPGTVVFSEAAGSLIVRASAEVHFMVSNALYKR